MNKQNQNSRKGDIAFIIVVYVLGTLNLFGTESTIVSLFASFCEYAIVLYYLFKGNYKFAYIFFLAFAATTLEVDIFVYGDKATAATHERYTFFHLPVLHMYLYDLLAFTFLYKSYKETILKKYTIPPTYKLFIKCILIMFITGSMSVIIGMFINDNNIMDYGYYPKVALMGILGFMIRASVLVSALYITCNNKWHQICSKYLYFTLISLAFVCVTSALLGFKGFYGESYLMLSSLAVAYTPFLLIFVNINAKVPHKSLALIAGILVIVLSFAHPTCIGSKWYLIILVALAGWFILLLKIKSAWKIVGTTIIGLLLMTLISQPLISLLSGGNDFVEWKLTQAVNTVNIFGSNSAADWYDGLDDSPLFRIDEPHNTFIEYQNKPWFALFGKGFGGSTRHHTNLLSWERKAGAFSEDQVKTGAYYQMHETFAVLFLQNGILGLFFFFSLVTLLIKRLYKTPWAMVGLIYIAFYWAYGSALVIGGIAMILALHESVSKKAGSTPGTPLVEL